MKWGDAFHVRINYCCDAIVVAFAENATMKDPQHVGEGYAEWLHNSVGEEFIDESVSTEADDLK